MRLVLYIDGGSRGNPGPAGAGVVLTDEAGKRVHEAGYFLGKQTNNAAEYYGLLRGLERAAKCKPERLSIYADSELLVRQITGEYRVKSPSLAKLYEQAQILLVRMGRWSIQHVRREGNAHADRLANMAMDERRDVVVFDVDAGGASAKAAPPTVAAQPAVDEIALADECDETPESPPSGARLARITPTAPPRADDCPCGGWCPKPLTVDAALPTGMCVYAAHALLPTILALRSTVDGEFSKMPAMTVRCTRMGCRATFVVSPAESSNGKTTG
ncbi:MAG: ribonuclease HI family protein [Planctomycetes bacterium]|nr:ribonuclease HI family protein [Planctomycetota bacterium]